MWKKEQSVKGAAVHERLTWYACKIVTKIIYCMKGESTRSTLVTIKYILFHEASSLKEKEPKFR